MHRRQSFSHLKEFISNKCKRQERRHKMTFKMIDKQDTKFLANHRDRRPTEGMSTKNKIKMSQNVKIQM